MRTQPAALIGCLALAGCGLGGQGSGDMPGVDAAPADSRPTLDGAPLGDVTVDAPLRETGADAGLDGAPEDAPLDIQRPDGGPLDSGGGSDGGVACPTSPCPGGKVCCATGGSAGINVACAPQCTGPEVPVGCMTPAACSPAAPICCATVTVAACNVRPMSASCVGSCADAFQLSCDTSDTYHLCGSSSDCAADGANTKCCRFNMVSPVFSVCVDTQLAGSASSCN